MKINFIVIVIKELLLCNGKLCVKALSVCRFASRKTWLS